MKNATHDQDPLLLFHPPDEGKTREYSVGKDREMTSTSPPSRFSLLLREHMQKRDELSGFLVRQGSIFPKTTSELYAVAQKECTEISEYWGESAFKGKICELVMMGKVVKVGEKIHPVPHVDFEQHPFSWIRRDDLVLKRWRKHLKSCHAENFDHLSAESVRSLVTWFLLALYEALKQDDKVPSIRAVGKQLGTYQLPQHILDPLRRIYQDLIETHSKK